MKQVITLAIACIFTLTSFATVKPAPAAIKIDAKKALNSMATLKLSLKAAGKVQLTWTAGAETTTSVYQIEKKVNNGEFKTVAILMGETNDSYTFRDSIKDVNGDVQYRVVMVDNNEVVYSLTQNMVIL
jgi:hypothetical protein